MKKWEDFEKESLSDPKVEREYQRLKPLYDIIEQIVELRVNEGLNQTQIAKKLGTTQSAISRLESGDYNPTIEYLDKIATALGKKLEVRIY